MRPVLSAAVAVSSLAGVCAAITSLPLCAQAYPVKPIELIVHTSAGSGGDVVLATRTDADMMAGANTFSLAALGGVLIVCYIVDRKLYPSIGAAGWLTLRFRLTVVSSLSCFFAAAQL